MRPSKADLLRLAAVRRKAASGEARALRIANDLILREVGEYCGVSADTIRGWEIGRCVPRGLAALRYERLLEDLERAAAS
jgi:DNA-binding transcriptional regulator YiaG